MPPKVLQKNPDRGSGVLPVPASARAPPAPKPPAARLKLEIRRLPPGLTLSEFEETLGEEWKLGKGRVDWREYRQGKAKNVSKMPELSRCYVHLVKEDLLREFEARFLAVTFRDKAGTWKNGVSGAPMLGFAPNQRVPLQQGKQRARADNRQGTIDQDAEYMAFLEAETQPIPKASAIDSASVEKKEEEGGKTKVKSTPLIEDLRERKANKAKAAASKAEKADRKGKSDSKSEESTPAASGSGGKKGDKGKVEQAAKEVAKTANKQASGKQAQSNSAANANANANANATSQKAAQTPAKGRRGAAQQNAKTTAAAAQPQPQSQTTPAGPAAQRGPAQRQRGNAEGIKKMLQKDLGIKPKAAAADAPAQTGTAAAARNSANNQQTPAQPKTPAQTPKQQQQQQQSSNSGLPKAYLKHANPSQGMTEILIQQALAQFGEMNNVTIDPRKGTAIAVFKTQEGLKKAVQAKKVPVAKGAVEVIEFKDRGGGGAGSGGGSGGNSNNNANASNTNNSGSAGNGGGGGGGGGGGRGGFRNRGGRAGRGGNNNSGAANANAGKGGGQAAAAPPAAG
jgi:regulator of nonsense transcripts 3